LQYKSLKPISMATAAPALINGASTSKSFEYGVVKLTPSKCSLSNFVWQYQLVKFRTSDHNTYFSMTTSMKKKRKIFLHIACCCIGEERDLAVRLWNASGSKGFPVFENLQKRCLVDVDGEDCLVMHEYLRELGRSIADKKGLRGSKGPRQSSNERVITELGRSDGDLSQQ